MEEFDDGSHACCSGKIAVRDEIQLRCEHLLRRKKTNEIGVTLGGQARQDRQPPPHLSPPKAQDQRHNEITAGICNKWNGNSAVKLLSRNSFACRRWVNRAGLAPLTLGPLFARQPTWRGRLCAAEKRHFRPECSGTNGGYSITSSARPDSGSGILTPSALALLRLMKSSTLLAR